MIINQGKKLYRISFDKVNSLQHNDLLINVYLKKHIVPDKRISGLPQHFYFKDYILWLKEKRSFEIKLIRYVGSKAQKTYQFPN